jgi:hypothetical protein
MPQAGPEPAIPPSEQPQTVRPLGSVSEYAILIAVPLQQWLHERPSLLRYIACIFTRLGTFLYSLALQYVWLGRKF